MSLLQMSISAAVMVLAVIVIRALTINSLPKKTFIALWGIVLLRLLLPFHFSSSFSAYTFVNKHIPVTQAAAELKNTNSLPAGMPNLGRGFQGSFVQGIPSYVMIWGMGMIFFALFFAISYFKCRREFRESLPLKTDFLTIWTARHQLLRPIEIRQSGRIVAPLTYGVFKPVILVPKDMGRDDTKRMEYILAHEFVHVRRFDAAAKLVLTAALCIHWFNPLVWAMYFLSNRDIELSCDEAVVRSFGDTAKSAYARTLISMEEKKNNSPLLCSNFCKNAVEERIEAIMKMKKTSAAAIVVSLSLIGGVTTVFATSASANSDNRSNSIEEGTCMSQRSDDGSWQYSLDDGSTWISETDYHAMYPQDKIVWWTYGGYKAWVDEQRVELPKLIGAGGKCLKDGKWVEWPQNQEEVDKTIKSYEKILEDIKNGYKVSKTVNGDDSIGVVRYPPQNGESSASYGAVITDDDGKMPQDKANRLIEQYE